MFNNLPWLNETSFGRRLPKQGHWQDYRKSQQVMAAVLVSVKQGFLFLRGSCSHRGPHVVRSCRCSSRSTWFQTAVYLQVYWEDPAQQHAVESCKWRIYITIYKHIFIYFCFLQPGFALLSALKVRVGSSNRSSHGVERKALGLGRELEGSRAILA